MAEIKVLFSINFAFSLFGHYEIQVPSTLRQFSSQQEQKGGVIGILFMALTFTLTSFTCTVQFVGLLLVAASQGEFFWPAIGMVAFSTAFAFPFFFLALYHFVRSIVGSKVHYVYILLAIIFPLTLAYLEILTC